MSRVAASVTTNSLVEERWVAMCAPENKIKGRKTKKEKVGRVSAKKQKKNGTNRKRRRKLSFKKSRRSSPS
jgi:hypothetical protein